MSGHSKWATIKRHKAAVDAKRGKAFSLLSKEITLAARAGGGDIHFNARLRTAIQKAKASNMPADNIDRAVKKGTGELEGTIIEELTYEGYAPGGVGIIVEVTTDNKNRSASEVRITFSKGGGNLAGAGALAFNFQRLGQFLIGLDAVQENTLIDIALNAGAQDVLTKDDHYEVLCPINAFDDLVQALEAHNIKPESSEIAYLPQSTTSISDEDTARKVLKLIENLEDLEDVKSVFSNLELDSTLIERLG